MGRIINPETAGKRRNQLMRANAEMLRLLSQKQSVDDESKDMLAAFVFNLREIEEGVDVSAEAWEKRDYWQKAEEFRQRWFWAGAYSGKLASLLLEERWDTLPSILVGLMPYLAEIKITKMTVKPDAWQGCYVRLMQERPPQA
jgi:hypothetical protein